ncbi:hypothetical protein C8Q78DRAFT_993664 [Trametes maxima]|nr:hypothetical protein C8Q78DRAFT_993664 [Trametes maxima]
MAVTVPPAPPLPEEALREVYAYPDPARPPDEQNQYSDAGRLAIKGKAIAKMAFMDIMSVRVPARELTEPWINEYLEDFANRTVISYRWLQRVQCPQHVDRHSPAEIRRLFYTYVGAVGTAHPYTVVKQWFLRLMPAY